MMFAFAGIDESSPVSVGVLGRFEKACKMIEDRLGESRWLAGEEFTLADLMSVFTFTSLRQFYPFALTDYPNVVAWLGRCGAREGYKTAMAKGDPGFEPLLGAEKPEMLKSG